MLTPWIGGCVSLFDEACQRRGQFGGCNSFGLLPCENTAKAPEPKAIKSEMKPTSSNQ
jgi:hypothetical protein